MQVEPIVRITVFSSSQNWSNYKKEIAEEEASLRTDEASLKNLQDEMVLLTEKLEAIKSQGEQARIQEQGLSLAYQQTSQQVEELETLWKTPRRGS